ncbi:MAG: 5-oxoprolinase subunit PxpB [Candidatus Viridilinea halotolerans]|uniref:5-oxoprolinase subunit PxpB n=1 Tax=Candidatus Viridilinea halotolerans TaxID=2491704 RepID=A0A426TZ20_9CHLR|nr:MAG: 5-oxoprolinase subunit PxpB [Candidatus Viridilinea halotolerans]
MPLTWHWQPFGAAALLLEVHGPEQEANRAVLALAAQLSAAPPLGMLAAVPAISSLLITFDPLVATHEQLQAQIEPLCATFGPAPAAPLRIHELPVAYGGTDGPDLVAVAQALGMTPQAVITLHSGQLYRVMMLGFAPGFPYLGPLPAALHLPRRATPRSAVPPGAVAIAAGLTGIYPTSLPGGWHLIGRTPSILFDPHADPPARLAPGDGVRFLVARRGIREN